MSFIFALLAILINILKWALIFRIVLDGIQMFARFWRPRGIVLVVATAIYAITDPPVNFLKRAIPPLNLGSVSLDLGYIILLLGVQLLYSLLVGLTVSLA